MGPANSNPPTEICGDQELAKRFGVSAKTVYAWRQAGLPHRKRKRIAVYDAAQASEWITLHRKRSEPTDAEALSPAARIKLLKEEAKLRQERLKAAAMEREDAAATGNVLPRDEWELFAIEVVQHARDRFMRLPKLLCKHVPRKYHRTLQHEGEADVRKICEEMSRALAQGAND